MTVYFSLGSNVGNRIKNLRQACQALAQKGIQLRRLSSVYETEPVDFAEQDWFLNCVVEAETNLSPLTLLQEIQQIEEELGRQREQPKGPRTLDIDILLYGDLVLPSGALVLPHPRMLERRFVLEPLREIAPSLRLPLSSRTVEEAFRELRDPSQVRCLCEATSLS